MHVGPDQPSAWAQWNYSGYEQKPDYPEFQAVIQMMRQVGAEQGCGRAMWEYDPSLNRFGTTESLMLLPYFTNGCIDSQEGLLFESASSTPFHFINQDELSPNPSRAVVAVPDGAYGGLDVHLGIRHLQQMGVRYLLTSSTTVQSAASTDPSATLIGTSGPWSTSYNGQALDTTWKVYRIADSQLVVPLPNRPVVWRGVGPDQSSWLPPAVAWYNDAVPVGRGAGRGRAGGLDPGGRRGPESSGGAGAEVHRVRRAPERPVDLVPRRPGGRPRRGPDLVLPQLAGRRARRARTGWRRISWWSSRPAMT